MIRIHLGIDDLRKPRARFALDWLASAVGVFLRECESEVGLWEFWYGEEPDNDLVRKVALDGGLLVWMYANDEITSGPPSFDQQTHSQLKCDGVEDVPVWGLTREMSAGEAWGTSGGRTVITAERVGQGLICRIGCDLVSTVWWALARVEEQGADSLRDQHGRAKSDANTLVKAGCHHTPVLDRYAELLIWLFDRCWQTLGRPWVRIGRWPDDHSAVVLFSHDVDVLRKWTPWRVFHEMINTGRSGVSLINRAAQIIRQSDLSNDPYAAVGRTCDFEREAGVTSTWFMSAGRKNSLDPSYTLNHPLLHAAVGQIDSIGGEVGLHASYSWADSSDGLGFGRSVLGRTFGREVCGNRTHYLRHQAGATWQALESAGFAYDATLGFSDDVGFRSWTSLLFHPYDVTADRAHSFAELPLSLMDVSLLWRLGVDRSEAIRISRSLWNSTANGGICSALFHPNGYDVEDYAYLAEWFEELVGWAVDDHRWMPTHIGLVEWWRARAQAKVTDNGGAWRFDSAPQGLTVIVGGRGSGETVKVAFGDDVHHIGVGERYVVPRPSSRSTKAASLKKPASDRSKVVMTVFNDLHHDARVNKEAVTLAENGYQVTVIANRTSERELTGWDAVETDRIPLSTESGLRAKYAEWWPKVAQRIVAARPNLVHAHDLDSLAPAAFASVILGVPLIYDSHELWTELPSLTGRPHIRGVWSLLEKLCIRLASRVITVSDGVGHELNRRYAVKGPVVVRNFPRKVSVNWTDQLRTMAGVEHEVPLLLFQGGLLAGLGIDDAIDVVDELPAGHLVVLGDGPLADDLKNYAANSRRSDRVSFLGAVDFSLLPPLTAGADVGLHLGRSTGLNVVHGLPNKVFEYIQAGVPVVLRDYPDMAAVVREYDVGVVVPIDAGAKRVAEAIGFVLDDRERLAANCHKAAGELHWEIEEKRLLSVYRGLM